MQSISEPSLDLILPFLEPIADVILDPGVSEIMVNGNGTVFVERGNRMQSIEATVDRGMLEQAVKRIARPLGLDFGEHAPILDATLPDSSRVSAIWPGCSVGGITLTIRKFARNWFTLDQLVALGAMPPQVADVLTTAVLNRRNILFSGGTSTGKTTFAKALLDKIPAEERIGVIEDTAELQLCQPNIFRLVEGKEQRASDGTVISPPVTIRHLLKAALRNRPDRIVLGEMRAGEAYDLLGALNSGHAGSISTIHANSPLEALSKLLMLVLQAPEIGAISERAIMAQIGSLIDLVVQLERRGGCRRIAHIEAIERFDYATRQYVTRRVYRALRETAS